MKNVILALVLMIPSFGFANDDTTAELLETLIANSSIIELSGNVTPDETIAGLLALSLSVDLYDDSSNDVIINSISSECEMDSASNGGTDYTCRLTILDGDFERTNKGFKGPELESSMTYEFQTTKTTEVSCAGCAHKHQLVGKTVKVSRAG